MIGIIPIVIILILCEGLIYESRLKFDQMKKSEHDPLFTEKISILDAVHVQNLRYRNLSFYVLTAYIVIYILGKIIINF